VFPLWEFAATNPFDVRGRWRLGVAEGIGCRAGIFPAAGPSLVDDSLKRGVLAVGHGLT
jgi:hypothetical protein